MPIPQIVKVRGEWGIYSWADGFTPSIRFTSEEEEAKRNPEAIINRLMREGRWEEAEDFLSRFF